MIRRAPLLTSGAGTGTVTFVSGVDANGVTWSIANDTTTPEITITLTDITPSSIVCAGNIKASAAGSGLYVKEGTNATMGTATLSGGTATVNTTKVTANSRIFLTVQGGTLTHVGALYVSARTAGTSFTVSSLNVLDASDFAWLIIEPA